MRISSHYYVITSLYPDFVPFPVSKMSIIDGQPEAEYHLAELMENTSISLHVSSPDTAIP